MDVELYSISLRGGARISDRVSLGVGGSGDALRTFPTPSPSVAMRNYMNWFRHILLSPLVRSQYLTPDQLTGSLRLQHHKSL
jgi:hypothetical protein